MTERERLINAVNSLNLKSMAELVLDENVKPGDMFVAKDNTVTLTVISVVDGLATGCSWRVYTMMNRSDGEMTIFKTHAFNILAIENKFKLYPINNAAWKFIPAQ